ncbi:MAG: 16S rRNA (guanine(527)-N(7))-methyltransferase RsmG [Nocardioidaceae bacterium]
MGSASDRPAAPAAVSTLFPNDGKAINQYVDILISTGTARGLIGPREVPRIWDRHILNCAVVGPLLSPCAGVCDVGSGAGLPGLVLAIGRRDLHVTLVEPLLRRVRFLHEVVASLDLDNVEVVRTRAEELAGSRAFDVVTARAVAPLARLAGWCLPLCRPGGELLALKGANAAAELDAAHDPLQRMNAGPTRIETVGDGVVSPPTQVVRIESGAPAGAGTKGSA